MISQQIIQLVEGRASAYVFASPGCKKWDTCAPEALLTAVGGTVRSALKLMFKPFLFFVLFYFFNIYPLLYPLFSSPGKLTDMHGKPYSYHANVKHMNSAGVLATLRNHEYYLSRVPQTVAQALKAD